MTALELTVVGIVVVGIVLPALGLMQTRCSARVIDAVRARRTARSTG